MSTKTEIRKLEEELEHLKKEINKLTIDMDDPNYAFYVFTEWDQELDYFECLMFKKKPVNRTAINYELHKLYELSNREINKESDDESEYNPVYGDIPEYNILKNLPAESKKGIYKNDPKYMIYKKNRSNEWKIKIDPMYVYSLFEEYNKASKEYEKQYGYYCFCKIVEKSDAIRGIKRNIDL